VTSDPYNANKISGIKMDIPEEEQEPHRYVLHNLEKNKDNLL